MPACKKFVYHVCPGVNSLPHVCVCCKSLTSQVFLKGSKEMEVSARDREVHNYPHKLSAVNPLLVRLAVWGLTFPPPPPLHPILEAPEFLTFLLWQSHLFYILFTVHHAVIFGKWPTWHTNSFLCIYFFIYNSLHVSSTSCSSPAHDTATNTEWQLPEVVLI